MHVTTREANEEKRVDWCKENVNDDLADAIWTDESSIQLETHLRTCSRKIGQPPKPKPRYMYMYKFIVA